MAAASHCPPTECPIGLGEAVARHDERVNALDKRVTALEKSVSGIYRRMDKWMTSIIALLLIVLGKLLFGK
jgi:hypothetical protein